jgi:hypothetical protein
LNKLIVLLLLLTTLNSATSAADEGFTPHLTDCATFFGLLAQSQSNSSGSFRSLASAFSTYAVEVIPSKDLASELEKSKQRIGLLVSESRSKNDESGVAKQTEICFAVLKSAETELWPRLTELSKLLTPKFMVKE